MCTLIKVVLCPGNKELMGNSAGVWYGPGGAGREAPRQLHPHQPPPGRPGEQPPCMVRASPYLTLPLFLLPTTLFSMSLHQPHVTSFNHLA